MDYYTKALELHKENKGKIEIKSKVKVTNLDELATAYSPGVAQPCREIEKNLKDAYLYTNKGNTIAVVSDGSAVLGLGDIGADAALPVMEGKALLFKEFANIDAIPLCIDVHTTEEIVNFIKAIQPNFGGILMEDICAPKCVEIERILKKELNIPVFHDDQHGTAIIALAAIINYLKLTNKNKETVRVVVSGAGAAGSSIMKLLALFGIKNIEAFDINGQIRQCDKESYDFLKQELLEVVNLDNKVYANMKEAFVGADIFLGVSAPGLVTKEMVSSMNDKCAIFAMANPTPEIMPEDAIEAGAYVVGSGRSDYPNQVNNVLAFPGLFRGVLDAGAIEINDEMKMVAANALASIIATEELRNDYIIPEPFDPRVVDNISKAVGEYAINNGLVR